MKNEYAGVLFIGDPHLTSRVPGYRRDEYPTVILEKLEWCLTYATQENLLPAILGDLFHYPRDNANWLLARTINLLSQTRVLGIFGNHDYNDATLREDDSFSVVDAAGVLERVDVRPWTGTLGGRPAVIGGSSHGRKFPDAFDRPSPDALVFWMTHHDLLIPGYEEAGRVKPRDIAGIDAVINGHIHRNLADVRCGQTLYLTPGNIARVNRSDASAQHTPCVLRVDVTTQAAGDGQPGWTCTRVPVPHKPFAEVFHEAIADQPVAEGTSSFISGLAELQARATGGGEGLLLFLERNCTGFSPEVRAQINELANEVIHGTDEE
ncbi:MAG: metallophosphoesterase [Planctomycetota bacterium]|nr:metallophosphoesterase [Planctomycetota bacterium]